MAMAPVRKNPSVGVRELRENLSAVLRRVKKGESIEVTEHGHPIAILRPSPVSDDPWQRLIDSGVVVPGTGNLADLPPPVGPIDPERSRRLREALEEQRADRF